MSKLYGGGEREDRPSRCRASTDHSRSSALPASTYTPEEARMAEQYARDAMADANWPSEDNAHRVWRT